MSLRADVPVPAGEPRLAAVQEQVRGVVPGDADAEGRDSSAHGQRRDEHADGSQVGRAQEELADHRLLTGPTASVQAALHHERILLVSAAGRRHHRHCVRCT